MSLEKLGKPKGYLAETDHFDPAMVSHVLPQLLCFLSFTCTWRIYLPLMKVQRGLELNIVGIAGSGLLTLQFLPAMFP